MAEPHFDSGRLAALQLKIAERALRGRSEAGCEPRLVAGLDISYSKKYGGVAVAALVDFTSSKLLEVGVAVAEPPMQYVPGFLAFREAPLMYAALKELSKRPEVLIVDGHGQAHPRWAGIAVHIGAATGIPSIGVAKKKLVGEVVQEEGKEFLVVKGRRVAVIIRAPTGGRLYVSPGFSMTLSGAENIVVRLFRLRRHLPDPLYYADSVSRRIARKLDEGSLKPGALKRGLSFWLKLLT